MTLVLLFGCALVALGPSISLFIVTISKYPIRIILMVVGSFFWLLSLLFTSLIWLAVVPLRQQLAFSVVVSVLLQEAFRFALYKIMKKAKDGLSEALTVSEVTCIKNHKLPYVAGFGFGLMECLFSIVNVLAQLSGPGVTGIQGQSPNYFFISALISNSVVFNNICWNIMAFQSFEKKQHFYYIIVPASHLFVAMMSLVPNVAAKITSAYLTMVVMMVASFITMGGKYSNMIDFFKACFNRS